MPAVPSIQREPLMKRNRALHLRMNERPIEITIAQRPQKHFNLPFLDRTDSQRIRRWYATIALPMLTKIQVQRPAQDRQLER